MVFWHSDSGLLMGMLLSSNFFGVCNFCCFCNKSASPLAVALKAWSLAISWVLVLHQFDGFQASDLRQCWLEVCDSSL